MKKATIKLIRKTSLVADPRYEVVQLTNCAFFTVQPGRGPAIHVGDEITEPQAEDLATDRRFTVTISKAKE